MKLSDFFPTESEIDKAKATVAELSKNKIPTESQANNMRIANGVLARNKWVRIAIVSAGLSGAAGLAGYGIYSGSKEEEKTEHADIEALAQSNTSAPGNTKSTGIHAERPDTEEKVDSIIQSAEAGIEKLQKIVADDIERINDEETKNSLNQAFLLMKMNRDNPNKNYPRFLKQLDQKTTIFKQNNINFFAYDATTKGDKGTVAIYIPPQRLMKLSPEFDKDNLLDALILYHECQHVMQDTLIRSNLDTKEKFDKYNNSFFKKRNKIAFNVLAEGTAYAFEIELLDMILDGKLRRGEKPEVEDVRKTLNAKTEQRGTIELLLGMAEAYFGSNSSLSAGLNKRYLDHLVGLYDPRKYEPVWDRSPHN